MFKRMAVLLGLFFTASTACAAEIKCLCPVAMRALLGELAPQFERASGHKLTIDFATLGVITERVTKGEAADVAIVSPRQAEDLEKQGRLLAGSRMELSRVGYGLVVRKGALKPDISSVEALKRTLLNAKSISHGDPAGGGPSGIYVAGLMERLGLAAELKPKTKLFQNAELVVPAVANGDAEIGFTVSSAAKSATNVEFIPLPAEVQNYTVYMAGVVASSKDANAARALINFLSSAAGKDAMKAKGFEPR
jgi:molybdate transport system substrate-binding protein